MGNARTQGGNAYEKLFSMENVLGKDELFSSHWQKEEKKGLHEQ